MGKNFTNNNFHGSFNGLNSKYYDNKLKANKKNTIEDEIDNVKGILGVESIDDLQFSNEFWTKVFLQNDEDEYIGGIKLILNKSDSLYSESNIAKTLERAASNILDKDRKKDNCRYIKVYHSKKLFDKAVDESESLQNVVENTSDGKYALENNLDDFFILGNQSNYKCEKKITELSIKDLAELNEVYKYRFPIVNEYFQAYVKLKKEYDNFTQHPKEVWGVYEDPKERKKHRYKKMKTKEDRLKRDTMRRNVYSLREDFINSIEAKARFIRFKCPLPDAGSPSWDKLDFLDETHIRELLQVQKNDMDLQDDLSCIVRDLNNTISQCEFTDMQQKVLELYRKDKTQEDIGNILDISKQVVNKHITAISKKIADKNLEMYTDWYYLNISRGEYKKCSKCGEIKLTQYFSKKGNRLQSQCKQCQSNK